MSNIPEDVKSKIEAEAQKYESSTPHEGLAPGIFLDGVLRGYSLASSEIESLKKEVAELKDTLSEANGNLSDGRHYLMGVDSDKITVEDSLQAFGFGRNGLRF